MTELDQAFARLDNARDVLEAVRFSVFQLRQRCRDDISILDESECGVRLSHLRDCADGLECVYILMLFAEFEASIRDYWASVRPRRTLRRTSMEVLMKAVAARTRMVADHVLQADRVRELRNGIVHHRQSTLPMNFVECKSHLSRYLSWLPRNW